MNLIPTQPFRVLVVDDDASVRATYRHILQPPASELDGLEALISGSSDAAVAERLFEVVEANQGETAAKLQQAALAEGQRIPLAFIDMRMPPGWDGMRTAVALRAQDPSIYIVIATAFSDYDVDALQRALEHDLVLLRKPFNQEEVLQLARTLCQSWQTRQRLEAVTAEMERRVLLRTADLERRHALQAVLIEITTRFIEAGGAIEVEDAVAWSLARLGRAMCVDGCAMYRLDAAHDVYRLGHEWHALGVLALPEAMHVLDRADIGPAHARFLRGEPFSFNRLQVLPAEMAHLRGMLAGHYESVLAVPLETGGRLAGFFAIGMTRAGMNWEAGLDKLLLAVGHTINRVLDAHEANRKLREGEARYQTLVQSIPGMVYRCALDANWTIQFMSDYIETLSGYPVSDFVDNRVRSYASLIHPDDVANVERDVRAAVARHAPYFLDYRIVHANGDIRWVHERGQASFAADGEVAWLDGVISDNTERKLAMSTLQASEEKYRAMFDNMAQGAFYQAADGHLIDVNQAALDIFGLSREQFMGATCYDTKWDVIREDGSPLPPEQHPSMRSLKSGKVVRDVVAGVRNPVRNDYVWININAIPLFAEGSKQPAQVFVTLEDITQRRRAEEQIRQNERRLRDMVEHLPAGAVYFDDRHLELNARAETITGYERAEFNNLNDWFDKLYGDRAAEVQGYYAQDRAAGFPESRRVSLRRKDGAERWVDLAGYRHGEGDIWLINDVTEQAEAAEALSRSESRFRSIVETAEEGIWQVDRDWCTVYVNRRMEELLGCAPGEMQAHRITDFMDADADAAAQAGSLQIKREAGHRETHDFTFRRRDGGVLHALVSASPMFDAQGIFTGATAMVTDITGLKRQEDSLTATAEFVSRRSGDAFCADLVSHAARVLGLDYVHVARLLPGGVRVETEAAWLDGKVVDNWSYGLADTPCFDVLQQSRRCIESGVQALYPKDADLQRIGAEGYVGEAIVNSRGDRLGLIAGITCTRLQLGDMVQSNLRILAARTAAAWEQRENLLALRSERNTTHNILQTAQVMIVALDTAGCISSINRKGCEILGYQEAELIGQDWFATCLPLGAQVEAVREVFRKSLAADLAGSEYYENPVRTRTGEERLIAWHNSSIRDAEGKVIGGLSAGMDITERRLAEARLLASEERFHKLFDAADAMSIQGYLADGTVVYWNRASEKIYGYSTAEALGGNLFDLIIPESMCDAVRGAVREMFDTERGAPAGRLALKHKDGSTLPVYSSHTVVKAPGQPTVMFCMDIDMRELDRVETELNVALTKYKTLFDCFPMGITVTDPAGHILETNMAATQLLGVPQAEHHLRGIDGPAWQILRTDGTPMPAEEFASVRALKEKRRVEDVEMGVVKADGTTTWISVTADLLPLEGYGAVITYGDITARREAEEQIRKLAYFDPLTNLPNRRLLMDRLGQALIASKRSQEYGALLMLDLDYFKQLNDTLGHDVGDQLLVEVAHRLSGNVRQEDTVSRLGGDEYMLILEGLGVEETAAHHQAEQVAEKIRLALNQPYALAGGGPPYPCSASIGVSLFHSHQDSIEALFKQADIALYQAKGAGRNAVRFYTPG